MKRPKDQRFKFSRLVYLIRTNAPFWILVSYVKEVLRNRTFADKYAKARELYVSKATQLNTSSDWFTGKLPYWLSVFDELGLRQRNSLEGLEIGSWEGLSSHFLLDSLPNLKMTCVDTWEGADEHRSGDLADVKTLSKIEERFDANLTPFAGRVQKQKKTSFVFFAEKVRKEIYDLIYVDGSHHCDDVIIDSIKSFEALKVGGIMVFDDYFWTYYKNPIDNPAAAIHAFLRLKKGKFKLLRLYEQLIIQKIQ